MAHNDLNLCQFIGHLGKDCETRYLPSGDAVANFSIACNWKGKDSEGVEWVRLTAFGKLAEICAEYLKKGSQVYVSGRMRTRKYQDREGNDRYSTEIVADRMQMLGGKQEGEPERKEPAASEQTTKPATQRKSAGGFDEMDNDIPF